MIISANHKDVKKEKYKKNYEKKYRNICDHKINFLEDLPCQL